VLAINLDGVFLTLQAAMRAIRSGGQGGAIVLTASAIAAKEGASAGIRINAIAPGGVETPIWGALPFFQDLIEKTGSEEGAFQAMGEMATPLRRYAKPEEIAEQVAFLLSEKASYTTGACLVSDGGYSL
jgi:NAD(P)-dependent dehydrogenase (short-subunit alcohol dehydrogenase family)